MEYDGDLLDPTRILRCQRCDAVVFVILDDQEWYDEYIGKLDRHNWLVGHSVETF